REIKLNRRFNKQKKRTWYNPRPFFITGAMERLEVTT
ncbi:MAG: hypothetical protein ACJAS1_007111, partial [Oleiphilaceae bacterium]